MWAGGDDRATAPLIISGVDGRSGGGRAVTMVPQPAWTPGKTPRNQWWEIVYSGDWPAAGLVAIGAAGLSMLTTQTPIVVAVATAFGITTKAALAFISGLTAVVSWQLDKVLDAICEWAGVCP